MGAKKNSACVASLIPKAVPSPSMRLSSAVAHEIEGLRLSPKRNCEKSRSVCAVADGAASATRAATASAGEGWGSVIEALGLPNDRGRAYPPGQVGRS